MRTIAIVGDDFVPSALLEDALRQHGAFPDDEYALVSVDLDQPAYTAGPVDGVREFLGEVDDWLPAARHADALVTTFAPVTARALGALERLRVVVCARGGPVNVDVDAATARNVAVAFTPGRNAEAVAEYVLGLLIALVRQIPGAQRYVHDGDWTSGREDTFEKPTGPELQGRVLGLLGLGAVGSRVAELVGPLGMRVIACDPYLDETRASALGVDLVALDGLLATSDVISVHARLPSSAPPILGPAEFGKIKLGAYVINTARPAAIDEAALVDALIDSRLAGAALDVFDHEPVGENHPLRSLPNVLLTPHAAGVSEDVPRHSARLAAESLARWFAGAQTPLANQLLVSPR